MSNVKCQISNIKKFLISLATLFIAVTASAQSTGSAQYWFSVFTPNPSFKVLSVSRPNPLWVYTPVCANSLCTYSIINGLSNYQFLVKIGSDSKHACNIWTEVNYTYGVEPSINLLSKSSCNDGLTYQQLKNSSRYLTVQIK